MSINIDINERFGIETGVGLAGKSKKFNFATNFYIYSEPFKDFSNSIEKGKLSDLMLKIPYVEIKAYYQTTLIQGLLNLLTSFADGLQEGMNEVATSDKGTLKAIGEKIKNVITNLTTRENWSTFFGTLSKGIGYGGEPISILKLPSALMLQLAATTGINSYTLPFFSQEIMKSSSTYGWGMQKASMLQGGTATGGEYHLLKTLAAFTTPMFNPNSGGGQPQTLTIEFDLFNDTRDKALANTEFVKTLLVRNMWLQYGIFQTPGALYDIKIGSGNTYFNAMYMCTGEFTITKKGVMRKMGSFFVPDVYNVKTTFSSLLPSNVNTYLFGSIEIPQNRTAALQQFLDNAKNAFKFGQ